MPDLGAEGIEARIRELPGLRDVTSDEPGQSDCRSLAGV